MVENQSKSYNLIKLKKKIFFQYILNINLKGFLFKFKNIKDIINYILKLKDTKQIRKL